MSINTVSREHYPFESHYFDCDGHRMHYLDEGAGDPIVMVHGNPTWSFYFRNLVLLLRKNYRVIVPDHIGCGLSDKPGDATYKYCLENRIRNLTGLIESLKLNERITLVLHDWGGAIGMGYATRQPASISRLILMNTAAFRMPAAKRMPLTLKIGRNTRVGTVLIRAFNAFAWGASRFAVTHPLAPEVCASYLAPYDSWDNRIATLKFVQDIPLESGDESYETLLKIEQELPRFKEVPTMICWGKRDFVFDQPFLDHWSRILPSAEVHEFPDAGHYVLEDEGNVIGSLAKSFLMRHPVQK